MDAVDTNVLIYVRDQREPAKQAKAESLIESMSSGALLWQVACEYVAASRKLASVDYGPLEASRDLRELRKAWFTVLPNWNALDRAHTVMSRFGLSFWDALLASACLEAGIQKLYSEDFGDIREIDGLQIINPFAINE